MLDRGETLVNVFKQNRNAPYSLFDEVSLIEAYKADYFAGVKSKEFPSEIKAFLSALEEAVPEIKKEVNESGKMSDEAKTGLEEAIKKLADGKKS